MLTDAGCKKAQPKEKPYKISDGGGMYLEVMPSGSKYWRLKYKLFGKERRLALGVYPTVSLKEAREERENAKKLIKTGEDPVFAKHEAKRKKALQAENSFEVVAREWHENRKERWSKLYETDILKKLEKDIFPRIGSRPIASISSPELLEAIRRIEDRGAHEIARRLLRVSGQVFKYAIATGRIERNPAPDLVEALKPYKRGHFAAIEAKELPVFMQTLEKNDARLYQQTRNAINLLMRTFTRTKELIEATWDEFDLEEGLWEIPAERMKMRKAHIVPLSKQALKILRSQKELAGRGQWVFPNLIRPKKPMSNNTILFALGRLGYKGRMTGHGFRALAMSTIKEELGYRHEVVDRQLAHGHKNQVDAAYDRAQFLVERKKMMQEWSDYLDKIANKQQHIIRLGKKRA